MRIIFSIYQFLMSIVEGKLQRAMVEGIPDQIKAFGALGLRDAYIPLDIGNARTFLKPSTTDFLSLVLSDN